MATGRALPDLPPPTPLLPDHAHVGYDIGAIPSRLRNVLCRTFYVEFYERPAPVESPERKSWNWPNLRSPQSRAGQPTPNSARIKIDFQDGPVERYYGISIEMVANPGSANEPADLDFSRYTPGKMLVRPTQYPEASTRAAGAFQFAPQALRRRVWQIVQSITEVGLHHFDFSGRGELLRGSRDFVYQVLMYFMISRILDPVITNIWPIELRQHTWRLLPDVMGKRFSDGKFNEHPIRRGRFRIYQRRTPNPSQYEP